jgi:hypothetical protein
MSFVATAVIGTSVVGGIMSSKAQKSAAKSASQAQTQAADKGIEEQRRQFDALQKLMAPYVASGNTAMTRYNALSGLAGPEAQQSILDQIQAGPEFGSLVRSGEEAILQSASATGGLRGGNTQAALAKFRPEILSSLIRDEYSRLGGMISMGQNAAAGVGNAGMNTGTNIANLYGQVGAAQAGSALARGQATADMWGNIAGGVGLAAGLGGFGNLGSMFKGSGQPGGGLGGQAAGVGGTINNVVGQFSDIRLKEDIERIGTRAGHNWYRFRYVWDEPGTVREGVMAHEVKVTHPEAVGQSQGYLTVDYAKLGIEHAAV